MVDFNNFRNQTRQQYFSKQEIEKLDLINNPPSTYVEMVDLLEAYGHPIGRGVFSFAYQGSGTEYIVKIPHEHNRHDPWLDYANRITSMQNNPHVPKLLVPVTHFRDKGYFCVMERLIIGNDNKISKALRLKDLHFRLFELFQEEGVYSRDSDVLFNSIDRLLNCVVYGASLTYHVKKLESRIAFLQSGIKTLGNQKVREGYIRAIVRMFDEHTKMIGPQYKKVWDVIGELAQSGKDSIDLHADNYGVNGAGRPVIVDPLNRF